MDEGEILLHMDFHLDRARDGSQNSLLGSSSARRVHVWKALD